MQTSSHLQRGSNKNVKRPNSRNKRPTTTPDIDNASQTNTLSPHSSDNVNFETEVYHQTSRFRDARRQHDIITSIHQLQTNMSDVMSHFRIGIKSKKISSQDLDTKLDLIINLLNTLIEDTTKSQQQNPSHTTENDVNQFGTATYQITTAETMPGSGFTEGQFIPSQQSMGYPSNGIIEQQFYTS